MMSNSAPPPYDLLAHFLSAERLNTYLRMAGGDKPKAAGLYLQNLQECQHFYAGLHWLEVGLRNAVHRELTACYGAAWYDNPKLGLGAKEQAQIEKAKEHLAKNRKPVTDGNMVAELSFGFWVNLFNNPYEPLWRFCLRKSFAAPGGIIQRKQLSKALHPMLKLRNRIAHYEPILGYDLPRMQQDMETLVRWIEPEMKELP